MPKTAETAPRLPWRDVAFAAGAAALAVKAVWGIERVRDVFLNDETVYMASGLRLLVPGFPNDRHGLPAASWSPLYACWYFLLHLAVRDPVHLYYASWSLIVVATSVALFVLARALGAPRPVALLTVFALGASNFFDAWPYPPDFAVLMLCLGALAALRTRDARGAYGWLVVTFTLCTFVRPEFALGTALVALLYARSLAVGLRAGELRARSALRNAAVVAAPAIVLVALFGSPLDGGRAFFAWGQHYALEQVTRHHLDVDPWLNWWPFVVHDFGPVTTVSAALRANPSAFFEHVAYNVRSLPDDVIDTVRPALVSSHAVSNAFVAVLGLGAAVGAVGLWLCRRDKGGNSAWCRVRVVGAVWLALLCETMPSALVIHARMHYLLPIVAVSAVLLAAGWRAVTDRLLARYALARQKNGVAALDAVAMTLVLLAFMPSRAYGACVQTRLGLADEPTPVRRETVAVVHVLRGLGIRRHVVALEQGYSYVFYSGIDFDRVTEWTKDRPFSAYMRDNDISLVVLSPALDQNPAFSGDAEYKAFAADPAHFGFRVVAVAGTPIRIALRNDVPVAGSQTRARALTGSATRPTRR